jgi:hypothetical protein
LSDDPVMVFELAARPDSPRWRELVARVTSLAAADSPHLPTLIEVGPDPDPSGPGAYLAASPGGDGTLADADVDLDAAGRIAAVAGVARAADALHACGLAHGAIRPEAIVIGGSGSLLTPPPLDAPAGIVAGAGSWKDVVRLEPSLLRGALPSRSSDLWALAATLHELLSDRPIYPDMASPGDEPVVTTVQRVLFTEPSVDPGLPGDVAAALAECFARDPAHRPASAAAFAERLEAAAR